MTAAIEDLAAAGHLAEHLAFFINNELATVSTLMNIHSHLHSQTIHQSVTCSEPDILPSTNFAVS